MCVLLYVHSPSHLCYYLRRYLTVRTVHRPQPDLVHTAHREEPVVEEEEGERNDLSARRLWGHDSPERPERGHDPNTSPPDQGVTPTPSHTEEEEAKSDESEGDSTDESGQYQDNYYDLYDDDDDDDEEEVYSLSLLGLPHTRYA